MIFVGSCDTWWSFTVTIINTILIYIKIDNTVISSISKMKAQLYSCGFCWTSHLGLLTVTCLDLDSVQSGGELVVDSEDVAALDLFRLGFFGEDSLRGLSTGQRLQRPHQLSLRDIRLLLDLLPRARGKQHGHVGEVQQCHLIQCRGWLISTMSEGQYNGRLFWNQCIHFLYE